MVIIDQVFVPNKDINELKHQLANLERQLAQVTAERDAATADIKEALEVDFGIAYCDGTACSLCKRKGEDCVKDMRYKCKWEWRGIQKEES